MKNLIRNSALLLLAAMLGFFVSCKKDKDATPIAGFTFTIDGTDFKTVHFTNTSQDFEELSWNFGDGSALSSEDAPTHTFAGAGEYNVSLTVSGNNGKNPDILVQKVTIIDPAAQLTALAGASSKSWKLLRAVGPGRWPLEVGPIAMDQVWWAQGRDNDEIALRPCIMNDEFIFSRDGVYTYDSNGDFWAEGGVFEPANLCQATTSANLTGPGGTDLSAFGDGTHAWSISGSKLTLTGMGAWIGLPKIGTDTENSTPQPSTTLDILKLTDSGPVDTLILESKWKFGNNSTGTDDAYWRITLVAYDDPSQEPGIPDPKPQPSFTTTLNGLEVTFNNTSNLATSYSWDFGDGSTSTEVNPVHTYASSGIYTVVLTANSSTGSATASLELTLSSGSMTADQLVGGAWRVRNAANSVVVGPGLGDGSWYQVSADALAGALTGPDDWSCMTDDEFIFTASGAPEMGTMQYKTNGTARNDGYMGTPQGCWTDAEIAASGNGAAFGSATHTYTFTPASASPSGRPIITLTNGPTGAAFLGFYKGYYGGENSDGANAPNGGLSTNQFEVISYLVVGGQEVMTVSVDISGAHDGSAAWTTVLVR